MEQQGFLSLRNQKKQLFTKFCEYHIKMETQKIINLLNDSRNDESKFATKKWYVIDIQITKGKYKEGE